MYTEFTSDKAVYFLCLLLGDMLDNNCAFLNNKQINVLNHCSTLAPVLISERLLLFVRLIGETFIIHPFNCANLTAGMEIFVTSSQLDLIDLFRSRDGRLKTQLSGVCAVFWGLKVLETIELLFCLTMPNDSVVLYWEQEGNWYWLFPQMLCHLLHVETHPTYRRGKEGWRRKCFLPQWVSSHTGLKH